MTAPPKVCVIIPAHNAQATVERAVRSALAQPEAREVLVVDDGSTDSTHFRASACDDGTGRLTVLRSASPAGPAAARNRAIARSRAPWICPLDADDFFRPGRLGMLLALAGDRDLIADDLMFVRQGEEERPPQLLIGDQRPLPLDLSFADFVAGNISRRGHPRRELGFLKPLMRRAFLQRAGLRYDTGLRLGEDLILYASALAHGARFRVVGACGYVAVERDDSLSARHRTSDLRALLAALGRLAAIRRFSHHETRVMRTLSRQLAAKLAQREALDTKSSSGSLAALWTLARSPNIGAQALLRLAADAWQARVG